MGRQRDDARTTCRPAPPETSAARARQLERMAQVATEHFNQAVVATTSDPVPGGAAGVAVRVPAGSGLRARHKHIAVASLRPGVAVRIVPSNERPHETQALLLVLAARGAGPVAQCTAGTAASRPLPTAAPTACRCRDRHAAWPASPRDPSCSAALFRGGSRPAAVMHQIARAGEPQLQQLAAYFAAQVRGTIATLLPPVLPRFPCWAGCLRDDQHSAKAQVVVIGGGYGWRHRGAVPAPAVGPEVSVVLIGPNETFISCRWPTS